jgi:hypothetical protein
MFFFSFLQENGSFGVKFDGWESYWMNLEGLPLLLKGQ